MSRDEDFLRAILDHPDDDGPRLVYADWLDEQGNSARAEFIRAQVQMERLPDGSKTRAALRRRARELLAEHREEWLSELPPWVLRRYVEFRRGFVYHVRCTTFQFVRWGERLLGVAPVQSLRLEQGEGRVAQLAQAPHLGRITALYLRGFITGPEVAALAASPYHSRLTALRLGCPLGEGGARALAAADGLANLTDLTLNACRLGTAGIQALARAPWLARLTVLRLASNDLYRTGGLRALLASAHLPRPTVLDLGFNPLRDEGVRRLARSAILDSVADLCLRYNILTAPGAEALAACGRLAGLSRLDLRDNPIGDAGARALLKSPHLGRLRRLDLRNCRFRSWRPALRERFGRGVLLGRDSRA